MFGAIIGDMAGSIYEWNNIKTKDFPLFKKSCFPTDDSIMTIAVAKAILEADGKYEDLQDLAVSWMQKIGRQYPNCGYGGRFQKWMFSGNPKPYRSFGNGSAMRVSPCGWAGRSLEETRELAYAVTCVTHDHPEGIKGAEATACAIYLARTGSSKEGIREFIEDGYYDLDFTLDEIRPDYTFDVTCQGSVPQAIEAFLESDSFEDAIRNAISIGGDSDTIAAITGGIAEAFYGIPEDIQKEAYERFASGSMSHYTAAYADWDPDLLTVIEEFEDRFGIKAGHACADQDESQPRITKVGLDMIDPGEVVVVMCAFPGAMGDAGAMEFYSIRGGQVLYYYGNILREEIDTEELRKHFPEAMRPEEGLNVNSQAPGWEIFGGGMGNEFYIKSEYCDELERRCKASDLPGGYYRWMIPVLEKLLLDIAKDGTV